MLLRLFFPASYSCMVVVGNGNGVLGWGQGKAAEVSDAVQKAYRRACKNLYPIPRYNEHTIPRPTNAKFGQVSARLAGWLLYFWLVTLDCLNGGV